MASKAWTIEDDAFLEDNVQTMSDFELAVAMGRTEDSIEQRRYDLCLMRGQAGIDKAWTRYEDDLVETPFMSIREKMELMPGRTRGDILRRRHMLLNKEKYGLNKKPVIPKGYKPRYDVNVFSASFINLIDERKRKVGTYKERR